MFHTGHYWTILILSKSITLYPSEDLIKIRRFFQEYDLDKTVHGPFMDLSLASVDPLVRNLTLKRYKQALEFCKQIYAKNIVFHTGYSPIFHREHKEQWLERTVSLWKKILPAAVDEGITVAMENTIEDSPDIPLALIKELDSDYFKACFDVAHYNVFSKDSIRDCLNAYPDIIVEVHISDNSGKFDEHLALGDGNIDFDGFFAQLSSRRIEPLITCEPHDRQSLLRNIDYLRNASWCDLSQNLQ